MKWRPINAQCMYVCMSNVLFTSARSIQILTSPLGFTTGNMLLTQRVPGPATLECSTNQYMHLNCQHLV